MRFSSSWRGAQSSVTYFVYLLVRHFKTFANWQKAPIYSYSLNMVFRCQTLYLLETWHLHGKLNQKLKFKFLSELIHSPNTLPCWHCMACSSTKSHALNLCRCCNFMQLGRKYTKLVCIVFIIHNRGTF